MWCAAYCWKNGRLVRKTIWSRGATFILVWMLSVRWISKLSHCSILQISEVARCIRCKISTTSIQQALNTGTNSLRTIMTVTCLLPTTPLTKSTVMNMHTASCSLISILSQIRKYYPVEHKRMAPKIKDLPHNTCRLLEGLKLLLWINWQAFIGCISSPIFFVQRVSMLPENLNTAQHSLFVVLQQSPKSSLVRSDLLPNLAEGDACELMKSTIRLLACCG